MVKIASTMSLLVVAGSACVAAPQSSPPHAASSAEAASLSAAEREAVAALEWLDSADPVADAQRAIAQRRPVLYTLGGRGAALPGVTESERARLATRCPTQILPGATDVVRGDTHLGYLQRAEQYAERYNRVIAAHCAP
jgi:hypothetical protein